MQNATETPCNWIINSPAIFISIEIFKCDATKTGIFYKYFSGR